MSLSLSYECEPCPFIFASWVLSGSCGMNCCSVMASTSRVLQSMDICSVMFFSCLTLPGHLYFSIRAFASSVRVIFGILYFSAICIVNSLNSRSMSSPLSRSGGICTGIVFSL